MMMDANDEQAILCPSYGLLAYFDVPQETYEGLLASKSKGSYMRSCVIDCYPYALMKKR